MNIRQRGQALVETAIFMPFFLLCLFGLIWAVQASSVAERSQFGVRSGGVIASNYQPYKAYSLYSIYATIDGVPPASSTNCYIADQTILGASRSSFFKPSAIGVNECIGGFSALPISTDGYIFQNTVFLQNNYVRLSASAPAANFLFAHGNAGINSSTLVSQNFFRTPDLPTMTCFTPIGGLVKASLEGFYDRSDPSWSESKTPPMPGGYPASTGAPLSSCQVFSGQPSPLPSDTPIPVPSSYAQPAVLPTQPTYAPGPSGGGGAPAPTATPPSGGGPPGNVS